MSPVHPSPQPVMEESTALSWQLQSGMTQGWAVALTDGAERPHVPGDGAGVSGTRPHSASCNKSGLIPC